MDIEGKQTLILAPHHTDGWIPAYVIQQSRNDVHNPHSSIRDTLTVRYINDGKEAIINGNLEDYQPPYDSKLMKSAGTYMTKLQKINEANVYHLMKKNFNTEAQYYNWVNNSVVVAMAPLDLKLFLAHNIGDCRAVFRGIRLSLRGQSTQASPLNLATGMFIYSVYVCVCCCCLYIYIYNCHDHDYL